MMRKLLLIASCFTVLAMVATSCTPSAAPTPPRPKSTESPAATIPSPSPGPGAPAPTPKPATASAGGGRYGGALNIGHFGDPISYDPIQESSVQSLSVVVPSYSGVVQHDPLEPTKVVGDLAERWDISSDGLSYTFHLHKNVKWHDGAPFSSEDARFSLDLVRNPPKGITSPRQEWLAAVDKVEAPDRDTLKVTLRYASASFLDNLGDGRLLIAPKHVFEAKGNLKRDIVGTGPYRFKSFISGASFSVTKNPDYFVKGRPYLDGIVWYIVPDASTRFAALRTHRIQVTPLGSQGLTPSQSETIQKELSGQVMVDNYPSLVFMGFWMRHSKAPWSDVRVRRAVDLTIDRPKIIKAALEGVGDIGGHMPPGAWGLPQRELMDMPGFRQPKDADIAEAKKLMAEAGYAQGFKATIMTRSVPQRERSAVVLKEQLAQIGIDATVRLLDQATVFDLLYKRDYDTAVQSGSASFDDPDQMFGQQFVSGVPRNFSDFRDEKIDKWYDEQARTMDPAKRKQIVLDMQRRMFELVPASILHWYVYQLGRWTEVRDYKPGIGAYNNLKLQNVWLAR